MTATWELSTRCRGARALRAPGSDLGSCQISKPWQPCAASGRVLVYTHLLASTDSRTTPSTPRHPRPPADPLSGGPRPPRPRPRPPLPPGPSRARRACVRPATQRTDCAVGSGEWAEPPHSPWTLRAGVRKRAIFRPFSPERQTPLRGPARRPMSLAGGSSEGWLLRPQRGGVRDPGRVQTLPRSRLSRCSEDASSDPLRISTPSERDEPSEDPL